MSNKVAILDAGGQYAKVIDRKVRELGVESDLLPMNTAVKQLAAYAAIIISGGPQSVCGAAAPKYDPKLLAMGKPLLGICYGMQLLVHASGGRVSKQARREDGPCQIQLETDSPLFKDLAQQETVLMSHGDSVSQLPPNYQAIAHSGELLAAIADPAAQRYGVQFHPEVDLTVNGRQILSNFLFQIAGLQADFILEDRLQTAVELIRGRAAGKQVLLLASGGVDSTVCAALLRRALPPEQIIAIHIDSGFMRHNESQQVKTALAALGVDLQVINAKKEFLAAKIEIDGQEIGPLSAMTDPQYKRQIIGDCFIRVTEQHLCQLKLDWEQVMLVQGTLRPDLIESASRGVSKTADTIKTHHNDVSIVRQLREAGRVIEPLADYHKDEVRQIGRQLGLPASIVERQPFPGPGLAIRILCAETAYVTTDYDQILSAVQALLPDHYQATLLPVRSVGVQGDGRTYSYAVALSATNSSWTWSELMELAREIPKNVHQLNRVVFVCPSAGPLPAAELRQITPTLLTEEVVDKLRQADHIVNQALLKHHLTNKISQLPVILIPVDFDNQGGHSVVLRPFMSNDFMTGIAATPDVELPATVVEEMTAQILQQVAGVSRVLYDLTSKPPGTTEWE